LPDSSFPTEGVFLAPNIKIISTGNLIPSHKRDLGAKEAQGRILAFLDDDTYPSKAWLTEAIKIFKEDENIACVCGPAVTPADDSLQEKASGLIYSSLFISGIHAFRYLPRKRRVVMDYPSCNFLIRRDIFNEVGGFNTKFWPGEDTFLCLKVLSLNKKMIYDPKVLVFHHRRPVFKRHLSQIKNYALHRGYFVKRYPKTSLRFEYFIPSLFIASLLLGGLLSIFFHLIRNIYLFVLSIYLTFIVISGCLLAFNERATFRNKITLSILVVSGIIVTHIFYGLYFIKGLFSKKMPEE